MNVVIEIEDLHLVINPFSIGLTHHCTLKLPSGTWQMQELVYTNFFSSGMQQHILTLWIYWIGPITLNFRKDTKQWSY